MQDPEKTRQLAAEAHKASKQRKITIALSSLMFGSSILSMFITERPNALLEVGRISGLVLGMAGVVAPLIREIQENSSTKQTNNELVPGEEGQGPENGPEGPSGGTRPPEPSPRPFGGPSGLIPEIEEFLANNTPVGVA